MRLVVPFAPGGSAEIVAPLRDFRPISLLAKVPSLYVVPADPPVKNRREFIALAKARPGRLNYGSAGHGSASHLAMEYLTMASDTFILPASAANKLALAAAKAIQSADSLARLQADAAMAVGSTPAEFARFIADEQKRWKPVLARTKVKPD